MNRDDVIRMAREAGDTLDKEWLERFAALVAAHVRETEFKPDWNKYQQGLAVGAAAEREACARWLEDVVDAPNWAEQIRARGQA